MERSEAGTYQVNTPLPEEMASITEARRLAREALVTCGFQGRHEDVLLVVSELVTNALVHGDGSPVLRVRGSADRVRIEVGDAGAGVPRTREPGPASGWGLHIVRLLSAGWGISPAGPDHLGGPPGCGGPCGGPAGGVSGGLSGGKVVWCELVAGLAGVRARTSEA
ncbi:ATP-binding protein [Nonomuraea sp. NPDC049419]|uniref:ATP-binding protein n=1 Tax=Nonomuraea sp. NPDC049419 TaxID=3155772 RepID=UPI0034179252